MRTGMIFRIDDVTSNTNFFDLRAIVKKIHEMFYANVWACITPFSSPSPEGAVYPNPPFKLMGKSNFYNVRQFFDPTRQKIGDVTKVSHGLIHADHSSLQFDAQEMSIATSCKFIGANTFVPPFNKWNQTTEAVCRQHNIRLVKSEEEGWRSLEHEPFDPSHDLWYFHPWRFDKESFSDALSLKRPNVPA